MLHRGTMRESNTHVPPSKRINGSVRGTMTTLSEAKTVEAKLRADTKSAAGQRASMARTSKIRRTRAYLSHLLI